MKNQTISLKKLMSVESYAMVREKMKNKKTQAVTMAILSFLTLSLFGIFAISPTLATIAQLNRQLSDKKEVAQKLDRKIQTIASLQQQYAALQSELPIINAALPQKPEASYLLGQLSTIAQNSNVTLSQIQIGSVSLTQPTIKETVEFPFTINASGTKQDMSTFIQKLSSFNRIIVLDQIVLSQESEQTGKVTLSGNGYYKK